LEKNILSIIAPIIIAFKYMLLFWIGSIMVKGQPESLTLLVNILIYWYWIAVALLSLILMFIFSGLVPSKTQEQKENELATIRDLFHNIPILNYLEGNVHISRMISYLTIFLVIFQLYNFQMQGQLVDLMVPFLIATSLGLLM